MNINREYLSKENTYAGQNTPKYIVIHETDNWNQGAGAKRHASAQAAGHLSTSVHYYSGSDGVYQAADHKDGTYSVGREYGGNHSVHDANNRNTINIEICVNSDGDYTKARTNAIALVKHLLAETGIPAERVIRHYDAKGKYCPRNMMDHPALWEDFKNQIDGQAPAADPKPEHKEPPQPEETTEKEVWYRVGTRWENGICRNQTGAYHNKKFAIADCKPGQKVFDEKGNVIYSAEQQAAQDTPTASYTQKQFILDVQKATGSNPDGYAGDETLKNTVTISRTKNRRHEAVTALERRLKTLGYYSGEIEADHGKTPCFGPGMESAAKTYQKDHGCTSDGEITARNKTWKSLLGMI
ncbi:MAG: N-acetylmuramoyl-L-alanine amidase [Lachnospiraceae bacterium]|nr:N-acetylmuramoyl-L-alanine amidase [Lachnospiraceae bacterium]